VLKHSAIKRGAKKLFAFGLDDFAATIKAVGADVVTQVRFARGRFNSQCRVGQEVVRAVHATLGRGFFILLNGHFLLLKNRRTKAWCIKKFALEKSQCPSDGAFTFRVHHRHRQTQQHFIFNQFDQTQGLAGLDRIAVGQCIQSFHFGFVTRQIQGAFKLNPIRHTVQATLARHLHLAADRQLQGQTAPLIDAPKHSTEQGALRKFVA
jgi:hypothetical protein